MKTLTREPLLDQVRTLPARKIVYLLGGHVLFGLGVVGMVLPVMPTTVFWIGAAACYLKSSPENYQRLIATSRTGKVIADYLDHGVINASAKRIALAGMAFSALIIYLLPGVNVIRLIGILAILLAATYVLTRPEHI